MVEGMVSARPMLSDSSSARQSSSSLRMAAANQIGLAIEDLDSEEEKEKEKNLRDDLEEGMGDLRSPSHGA